MSETTPKPDTTGNTHHKTPPHRKNGGATETPTSNGSSKKRRKVNHGEVFFFNTYWKIVLTRLACIYCRRSVSLSWNLLGVASIDSTSI